MNTLGRWLDSSGNTHVALASPDGPPRSLAALGVTRLDHLLHSAAPDLLDALGHLPLPTLAPGAGRWLSPVEDQEVWAAGVTYLRSKSARMEESDFSASAYDRVYDAERPEIFFKSTARKVRHPGETVGIRSDARWNVPEPELALVLDPAGRLVGCTLGNDMSSRDIEGENLLYLPQAKTYRHSCAVGPLIASGCTEEEIRTWSIELEIRRGPDTVFQGRTGIDQIKRRFDELAGFLFRCQEFPNGAVLLTGTGIVPPDDFTLRPGDRIRIRMDPVGTLENAVEQV